MNVRYGVWAATGLAPGLLDVQNYFGNNILGRFPKNFIQSWHFDNKISYRTEYKNTRRNMLKNRNKAEFSKQARPRLTIIFSNDDGKQEDAAGGIEDPYTYPLVQGIQPEMHGYIPIYRDRQGIEIWQVPKRVKYNFSAVLELDTISDQESALTICENILKVQYGAMLEKFKADYLLPNDLINTIYRVKYFDQIQSITSDINGDKDEKNEALFKLGDNFENELNEFSKGSIKGFARNNRREDKFFKFRQIYEKMYFQLSDYPRKTDGERIGSMYSKFTITFDGFFEFFKPNSYILKIPEVVNGHVLTDIFQNTGDINYFRDYNPMNYMKFYNRNERIPREVQEMMKWPQNGYSIIFRETDLTMNAPTDTIDFVDWMSSDKSVERQKYGALIASMSKEEFDQEFKVFMYNISTRYMVDQKDMRYDGEVLHIKNLNEYSLYEIYLLGRTDRLERKLRKIILKTEECNECNRSDWE